MIFSLRYLRKIDVVFITSSKFGTAFLGYIIAFIFRKKLAVDIRDVFSDNINSLKISKFFLMKGLIKKIYYFEKKILSYAIWINIVSPGFLKYEHFKIHKNKINVFTNGIDDIFINNRKKNKSKNKFAKPINITYAGNIGYGQGLEKTLIPISKHFGSEIKFNIIGDGSSAKILENKIKIENVSNINIIDPVPRSSLIKFYNNADILFLQLNDIKAFNNVLPSKIFEYGSFDKPILAGVSGTAKNFIQKNLSQSFIFHPNDPNEGIEKLNQIINLKNIVINNSDFVNNFNRVKIINEMTKSI